MVGQRLETSARTYGQMAHNVSVVRFVAFMHCAVGRVASGSGRKPAHILPDEAASNSNAQIRRSHWPRDALHREDRVAILARRCGRGLPEYTREGDL
jgi:hypothetical protein